MKSSYPKNISIISIVFISLILFLAIVNFYISIQFRNEFIIFEHNRITRIAGLCSYYLRTYEGKELNPLLRNLGNSFELRDLIITDTLGMVIYDSRRLPLDFTMTNKRVDFTVEFKRLPGPAEVLHQKDAFLYHNEAPPFYFYTTFLSPYTAAFDRLFKWHIFYITLSLLFIGFLGIFLIRNLFLPMRYVANLAKELGVEMQREDFVSRTFNEMFKKMKSKEETLIEFSAYIAHEFRNSIGAITGLARLIEKGKRPASDIIDECRTMEELINRLLEYSRPLKPDFSWINMKQLIDDALKRTSIPERIAVEKEIMVDIPDFRGDYELLLMAVANLLKNCVESITGKGKIEINAGVEDEVVVLSVADNGVGIEKEELDKIFNPFYSKKEEGMGLGLAYVKKIVELHSGRISVKSKKGEGTTFTLVFPLK